MEWKRKCSTRLWSLLALLQSFASAAAEASRSKKRTRKVTGRAETNGVGACWRSLQSNNNPPFRIQSTFVLCENVGHWLASMRKNCRRYVQQQVINVIPPQKCVRPKSHDRKMEIWINLRVHFFVLAILWRCLNGLRSFFVDFSCVKSMHKYERRNKWKSEKLNEISFFVLQLFCSHSSALFILICICKFIVAAHHTQAQNERWTRSRNY